MSIKLKDIAERAGVSTAVVSEVLRDSPRAKRFRPETRGRILQAVSDLNYKPNFFAAQIRKQNRKVIMLCVGALHDPYAGAIADAFEQAVSEEGYILLVSALDRKENADFVCDVVGAHGILMLAVVGYSSRTMLPDSLLMAMTQSGVQVVTIGRPAPLPSASEVSYDNRAAMESVVAHLPPQSRRIWLMGKPEKEDPDACAPPRIAATYQALRSTRPEVEIVTLQESGGPSSMHSTQRTIEEALRQHPAPDAVICTADQPALGAMRALAQAGLRVGHDVAVTGFNDDPMSAFLTPSLTTVRIPVETLGKQGARLLMDLYTHKQIEPVRIKVETTLMERESGRLDRRG